MKLSPRIGKLYTEPAAETLDELVQALGNRSRPEVSWVAQVAGCTPTQAERSVFEVTKWASTVLELTERIAHTGRRYYAQFPAPIELFALVRLTHPITLVESGVSSGVSSAFLLLGIAANKEGVLHSIDFPIPRREQGTNESWAIPAGFSSGWAVPPRIRRGWDLRLGRSENLLEPLLDEVGFVDFYCHDSPVDEEHLQFEMQALGRHLRAGSLVVADNTGWNMSAFAELAEALGGSPVRRRKSSLAAFRVPSSA